MPLQTQEPKLKDQFTSHAPVQKTVYTILFTISLGHLLNDLMQSVIPAVYPVIKDKYHFSFTQIGIITFTFQLTASILQPFVGMYTDKKPQPFSLAAAMIFTLMGIIAIAMANNFGLFLVAVALIGLGSSVFHPESSRVAHMASGGKKGLAQSVFQLGGNAGSAIGPLLAALIVIPYGQSSMIWFGLVALLAMFVLYRIGKWYQHHLYMRKTAPKSVATKFAPGLTRNKVIKALMILLLLAFSKYIYMASMTNYFTFYLIEKFQVSVQQSQYYLFGFLAALAVGTIIGGPIGDRVGRKYVIWFSILGVAPFTIMLPYLGLTGTVLTAIIIGVIISSAFSAILVYATDLVPGKIGMIAGLFFGFVFGVAGIGSAVLGWLADKTSISYVFHLVSFLPLIGIITAFLPNIETSPKVPAKTP